MRTSPPKRSKINKTRLKMPRTRLKMTQLQRIKKRLRKP